MSEMTFYLQQGYGMMKLNEEFADKPDDVAFILSPRSLQRQSSIVKIAQHGSKLQRKDKKILFDPQFYEPKTNMDKILKFPYFDGLNYSTLEFDKQTAQIFGENVIKYQHEYLSVDEYIIPGMYTNSITEEWFDAHENMMKGGMTYPEKKVTYQTLAIGPDVVKNEKQFSELINRCVQYPVDGYYIVLKSPDSYLIKNESYLYSLLDALISLNIAGKKVIMGYSNQQSLIFGGVGVSGIATGNYRNVRSFDPSIFFESDEDEFKRKGTWYFDGNTLGEYNQQQLSLAFKRNLKDFFGPVTEYSRSLLESPDPANIPWTEKLAFNHYLHVMNEKWKILKSSQPSQRIDSVISILESSKSINEELVEKRFRLGNKGFDIEIFESTISALDAIKHDRQDDIEDLKDL
ncbi:hypothetical protein NQG63_05385 [Exiguobacterium himgiriensis]|uniref:hypothetical protein n=2 Tax=Exiguobacterium TaxID=33986 RepID=UPI001BED2E46|nr:hypothetical protein [Exiguobacterium sp. s122]MCT4782668.1 hypothetical protein [Exiguobacterium himgiriensis]